MNRKKYRVIIKMVKTITMEHEQTSKIKAKEDVKNVLENSTKDCLNQIFDSEPEFIYKVKVFR